MTAVVSCAWPKSWTSSMEWKLWELLTVIKLLSLMALRRCLWLTAPWQTFNQYNSLGMIWYWNTKCSCWSKQIDTKWREIRKRLWVIKVNVPRLVIIKKIWIKEWKFLPYGIIFLVTDWFSRELPQTFLPSKIFQLRPVCVLVWFILN